VNAALVERIDHLVYATPNLDETVADLERCLGVRASEGGQHIGRGTRNALLTLGPRLYLEILGPDPAQPRPSRARWFRIDDLSHPRLIAWAANARDLEASVAACAALGVRLGSIEIGSRRQANGTTLHWKFTDPATVIEGGVVPFLIDWAGGPHPAASTSARVTLSDFAAEHPRPEVVRKALDALGLELEVDYATEPALIATLRTIDRELQLR
jgi:Glyoxalase-like domain